MKISLAADHNGFDLKNEISDQLEREGHEVIDVGPHSHDPLDDYPDYAKKLANSVSRGESLRGIMMMKKKPINIKKLSTLDIDLEKKLSLKNLYVPLKSKETEKIEGSPDEMADRIHHILKEDLRLI